MIKIIGILFLGVFAVVAASLRTNQLFIGDTPVKSKVSDGTIAGDRWVVVSNTLVQVHAEVTPIDGPPSEKSGDDSKDDSEPVLRLMLGVGQGSTKDRSNAHGGIHGLHGLLYMAKGLNTPSLSQTSRVDIYSTADKANIVLFVRDNGPIYSSTNSGMTWTVINEPGTYEIPLSSDSDSVGFFAKATIHPTPRNQTQTNLPPTSWYAVGSASDGSRLVLTENSAQSAPVLSIRNSGTMATVSWPSNFAGFVLQQCSDLTASNWEDVTNPVTIVGNENQVAISPTAVNNFFQLKSQSP